jgi:hypothetical protein
MICRIFNAVLNVMFSKIQNTIIWDIFVLSPERIQQSAEKICAAGCPTNKCWGFNGSSNEWYHIFGDKGLSLVEEDFSQHFLETD